MTRHHTDVQLLHFAKMCQAIYSTNGVLTDMERVGVMSPKFFQKGDDEAVVGLWDRDTMVVIFMGSEATAHDWLSNLNFFSMRSGWGWKAHRGFLLSSLKFEEEVMEYRNSLGPQSKKIIFMGHSRGGAQSAVLANHLKHERLSGDRVELVTFGSPRAFKGSGIKNLPVKTATRVVNNGDRVTKYPPAVFFFSHYGQEVHLPGPWWERLPLVSIKKSHFIHKYIDKIKRALM